MTTRHIGSVWSWHSSMPQTGNAQGYLREMRTRPSILLSALLLVAAILLVFRDELHARGSYSLDLSAEPTECGFWGPMSAGMSCR
jgi:hypothetical protein